jgi:hypothetical protein
MFNITATFGATSWSFLYKEKAPAESAFDIANKAVVGGHPFEIADDFGQRAAFTAGAVNAVLIEDSDLIEEARIVRSLANARGEVKARQRASTDPVIRSASQGPSVLQPRFNG